ncbi:MAG: carbamoyl-phosphate synthase large subunit, partial [Candidatus Marinimicrobia bacterium]|nr:carbamoyl-phosphate synthase large subunit [Candidatus Neomarinimicrobiota bacterium]
MPRDNNLQSILIIGAGPIVIGQGCEFDYSGTQACRALKEEGYRVILVNSNPATIMTDPTLADATYIEPVTAEIVGQIIALEKPDALLPTVGGQTGLNCALELDSLGILAEHHVTLLAADAEVIRRAEDREIFKQLMESEGIATANGGLVRSLEESETLVESLRFPLILRPSFTLGGTGGSLVYNREEYAEKAAYALAASPVGEVLIEEALMGWKEFELELMRDGADNALVVCSIENIDPMGVHTGDSVTVAPAQTLSDKEYQQMRDWALRCIRAVGVKTGGSNVQFAVNPDDGRMIIIEMNPRVSRSSALASKATGFPIAKVAAKLAVGYLLDEITNDITGQTLAAYEPTLDYVVTKVPRFNFEKFPKADGILGVQMQSVGEVMAIGRTFQESIQKAYRSLEEGLDGLEPRAAEATRPLDLDKMRLPTAFRLLKIQQALAQLGIAQVNLEDAKRETWAPDVSVDFIIDALNANYGVNGGMRMRLYDGGIRGRNVDIALRNLDIEELEYEQRRDEIAYRIYRTFLGMKNAQDNFKALHDLSDVMKRGRIMVTESYRAEAVATLTDMINTSAAHDSSILNA